LRPGAARAPQDRLASRAQSPAPLADGRARARQALGEAAPLRATHRLDAATCGLVVLGRTPAFVAGFNRLLAAEGPPRAVRKLYRALCAAPPPLGAPALTPRAAAPASHARHRQSRT